MNKRFLVLLVLSSLVLTTDSFALAKDTTAPVVTLVSPGATLKAGTKEATMSVNTNESSLCKYSTSSNTTFAGATSFTQTNSSSHSTNLSKLTNGTTYNYYIQCRDQAGNTGKLTISFKVLMPDPSAPTAPKNLVATATSATQINLSWGVSTDNVAVVKYQIFRNGQAAFLAETTTNSFSDNNLTASTQYSYTIKAMDAAGNISKASNTAKATTKKPSVDTAAPVITVVGPVGTLLATVTQVNLNVATNENATCKYSSSAAADFASMTQFTNTGNISHTSSITGLTSGTTYNYFVKCKDAANNISGNSTITFSIAISQSDIKGGSTLYIPFNGNDDTVPTIPWNYKTTNPNPNGKIGQGVQINGTRWHSGADNPTTYINPRRGSLSFWIRFDTAGNVNDLIGEYPGEPHWYINATSGSAGKLTINEEFDAATDGGTITDKIESDSFNFAVGEWHHFVWSWQGMNQYIWRDGNLVTKKVMVSPMPIGSKPAFILGGNYGTGDVTLDEIALYDYNFAESDAQSAFSASTSTPVATAVAHGLDFSAQWAPGFGHVFIGADPGNQYADETHHYEVTIKKNGAAVKTDTISDLQNGYAQKTIFIAKPLPVGNYVAEVRAKSATNATLDTKVSDVFNVYSTDWLGSTIGVSNAVQAPWTPIQVNGKVLTVWGRTYDLTSGFGLPQQITSQGQNLLANPVNLDIDTGSGAFTLVPQSITINSATPDKVTWSGTATANGINATVNGTLEYDGMMLIKLTLSPANGPITIQKMNLQTAMPAARAKFYSYANDRVSTMSYDPIIPTTPGAVLETQALQGSKTKLIPSLTISDDERGLEWFADSLEGWSVDQGNGYGSYTPFQKLVVDGNTNVRLENSFATKQFTLNSPRTYTFGYMATPVKSLPANWRLAQSGDVCGVKYGGPDSPASRWGFPGDGYRHVGGSGSAEYLWSAFALTPGYYSTVAQDTASVYALQDWNRQRGINEFPFVNGHVTLTPKGLVAKNGLNELNFLLDEVWDKDGYVDMLTPGSISYWMKAFDWNISHSIAGGVYIDETFYSWLMSNSMPTAYGYFDREIMVNRYGYGSLYTRELFKRLRQRFAEGGKTDPIWINGSAGYVAPHIWSFVDIQSDGEGIGVTIGTNDYIDLLGTANGDNWLRGISMTVKYGWQDAFLRYITGFTDYVSPPDVAALRAFIALISQYDIVPGGSCDSYFSDYMKPRGDFGINAPEVTFNPFWKQTEITGDNPDIKIGYYKRANAILAYVSNFGEAYNGNVTVNLAALGLGPTFTVKDAQTNAVITTESPTFPLAIPRHNYRILLISNN